MGDSDPLKAKGIEHYRAQNYSEAARCYSLAIQRDSSDLNSFISRSACYLALGCYREALQDCEAALHLDPDSLKMRMRQAQCLTHLGQLQQAAAALMQAWQGDAENLQIREACAELDLLWSKLQSVVNLQATGQAGAALQLVNELIPNISQAAELKFKKCELMLECGCAAEAQTYMESIEKECGQSPEFWVLRGQCFQKNDSPDGACAHFEQALRIDPNCEKAAQLMQQIKDQRRLKSEAAACLQAGEFAKAAELYSTAIDLGLKPNTEVLMDRATAYAKLARFEEAKKDLDFIIELDATHTKALACRAMLHNHFHDFDAALRDYQHIFRVDPNYPDIHSRMLRAKNEARLAKRKDYYAVLGITKSATNVEIKKAYRLLALQWHPDKHSATAETRACADETFKEICEAYAVLSDVEKRQKFDSGMGLEEIEDSTQDAEILLQMAQSFKQFQAPSTILSARKFDFKFSR